MYEVWWAGLVMNPTCRGPWTWWRKMPAFRRPLSGSREIVAAEVMYRPASSSWWMRNGSFVMSIWSPVRTTSWTGAWSDETRVVGMR